MRDGLYRVTTPYLCAGYVVKDGEVVDCAPILRKKISYWKGIGVLICTRLRQTGLLLAKMPTDGR